MSTTTAREIADWHRTEAKRLKARWMVQTAHENKILRMNERIARHERFAAWLEAGEHDEYEKSVARHIAALELTKPPIEAIDGGRMG